MRFATLLTGCLLLGAAAAQEPVDPKPSAAERMSELRELRKQAYEAWRAARTKPQKNADGTIKAIRMAPDYGPVADQALAFAAEFAGTDDAVEFLLAAADLDGQRAPKALETLVSAHLDSPKLVSIGPMLPHVLAKLDAEVAAKTTKRLMQSKSPVVRGWALFARHKATITSGAADSAAYKDARSKLMAAVEEVEDEALVAAVKGAIKECEELAIGCTAPDIAGVDLDGVEFKLSDYKGKVIFLDFWGDW